MASVTNRRSYTFDAALEMKDAGLVAASAAATVDSAAKIVDVGDSVFEGTLVIDVSAIEILSNTEVYDIIVQGSTSATFASAVQNLAGLNLGATEVTDGGAQDSTTGRYELPFVNVADDTTYPYLRVYTKVAGDVSSGINYTAFISKKL